MSQRNANERGDPVVIGATGGSGTRAVAGVLRNAGVFLGANVNIAGDAEELREFFDSWTDVYLQDDAATNGGQDVRMAVHLEACVGRLRASTPGGAALWGWKHPRSLLLLPFLDASYPDMRFVHVVRDGRDMAYSDNQNQVKRYSKIVVERDLRKLERPFRSIALWSRANLTAARYGSEHMGSRYLLVRYEDLCAEPKPAVERLLGFLDLPRANIDAVASDVLTPPTIGRWRLQDRDEVARLVDVGREALAYFGYTG